MQMPKSGRSWSAIESEIAALKGQDLARWREGRAFGIAYGVSEQLLGIIERAYAMYVLENARHQHAFPSLKRMESDVVAMTADLFHGEEAVGCFVTGGTEGIFLAVKTARDRARAERGIATPQMVVPATAYPIWDEVGHYLGVECVRIPYDSAYRADIAAMRDAITRDTILLMGSAPGYSFGAMDPIDKMSDLALELGIELHVDACVGGYQLPFLAKLGREVPAFDFSLPGVSSIGSDLHKYGYCAIGSSVLLYRNAAAHKHQPFQFEGWPSGTWRNPGMLGSRPGGAVAAAWSVMNFLGEDGYLELTRTVTATADKLRAGIQAIPGLRIQGEPAMSVFTYASDGVAIPDIANEMRARGWFVRPQVNPPSIHMVVTPMHEQTAAAYLEDLEAAASRSPQARGAAPL